MSVAAAAEREAPSGPTKSTSGKASLAAATEASEGVVLTPKNVHSLRTLFNVAHRLHHLLGPAWVLVLDILNTLDRILQSPRTTTQVHARKSYSHMGGGGGRRGGGAEKSWHVPRCIALAATMCTVGQKCAEKLFFHYTRLWRAVRGT